MRINSIKTVYLFAAVHGRPAGLRIARAGEQLAAQCEDIVIEFDIRYRIARAICAGLIGHIPCVCDTHIFLAGKLRHGSLCGILRRRAREQPHAVAHIQIADSLIPQRNGLRIARYGKRAAIYGKKVRCEPVRHGDAAAAVLGVSPKRQRTVQRQRAVADNAKGAHALDNSVQASDGILSVRRDKERVFTSDIFFAQAHRGQVGILELQIRENTAVPFKPAGRIYFQNILGCQIL